jgi:hypothetical protein
MWNATFVVSKDKAKNDKKKGRKKKWEGGGALLVTIGPFGFSTLTFSILALSKISNLEGSTFRPFSYP